MKRNQKGFFGILFHACMMIALIMLAFAIPKNVNAQQYQLTTLIDGGTNRITASGVTNYNSAITLTKYDEVGVFIQFKLTGAGTENIITTFDWGMDGSNWETVKSFTWTNAANGTTLVNASTNINVGALGYLRLKSISNGSAGEAVTNLLFKTSLKPKRGG